MRSKIMQHNGSDFVMDIAFLQKENASPRCSTLRMRSTTSPWMPHTNGAAPTPRACRKWKTQAKPDEKLNREGNDNGFLWRMNTYWRFEEKDGGTYIESQSISLTRDIPTGLGWMIGPYVNSVPRESLTFTLDRTRSAHSAAHRCDHRALKVPQLQNAKLKRSRGQERIQPIRSYRAPPDYPRTKGNSPYARRR